MVGIYIYKYHHETDHLTLNLWVLAQFSHFFIKEYIIPGWRNGSVGKVFTTQAEDLLNPHHPLENAWCSGPWFYC